MPRSNFGTDLGETPEVMERLLGPDRPAFVNLARRLREQPPRFVATCARGSSDCAALWFKALVENRLGLPVVSIPPSTASVYGSGVDLRGALFLAISQSGRSPDLLAAARAARQAGAVTVALVNTPRSPLSDVCGEILPMAAGPERSIAATKSSLGAMAAGLLLTAEWGQNDIALGALSRAPGRLRRALRFEWPLLSLELQGRQSLYVIGRGLGLAIASEAALKLKEVLGVHAEAFSSAEVLHGPIALANAHLPCIAFIAKDAGLTSTRRALARLALLDSPILAIGDDPNLPTARDSEPAVALLAQLLTFYRNLELACIRQNIDPDTPAGLSKVTLTR